MTFLLSLALLCAAGLALLDLARLRTGSWPGDLGLAWFTGGAWFALGAAAARFLAGVPYTRATALIVVAAPVGAWAAVRARRPAASEAPEVRTARWMPRPRWLFAALAAYVAAVTIAVALHGFNTPTQTDDGLRVRAYAPVVAWRDAWPDAARDLLVTAGAVPAYVPTLGWRLSGGLDQFHANYAVLAGLLALLLVVVGTASARGAPERGWASAFAVLSLPLFVYHCTQTYADAVLAMHAGAAFVFALEHARTRDPADAARALLLLAAAWMVKREGEIVAATAAALLVAQILWVAARAGAPVPRRLAWLAAPVLAYAAIRISAVGPARAFPLLSLLAARPAAPAAAAVQAPGALGAASVFARAVLDTGNAGMLFWVLPAAAAARWRLLATPACAWPLAWPVALFAESALSSIWLIPEYTINAGTVNRSLFAASVTGALWVGALLTERAPEVAPAAAGSSHGARRRRKRPGRRP